MSTPIFLNTPEQRRADEAQLSPHFTPLVRLKREPYRAPDIENLSISEVLQLSKQARG